MGDPRPLSFHRASRPRPPARPTRPLHHLRDPAVRPSPLPLHPDFPSNSISAEKGVADKVGNAAVTVVGHSLGSAIATYLTYDLAKLAKGPVSACLFASPRTGNAAWVAAFDAAIKDYALFNYILDIVPKVPFDALPLIQYSTLPRETVLDPR